MLFICSYDICDVTIFNLLVQASTLADNVLGSAAPVAMLMPHGRSIKIIIIESTDRIFK